jgi:hypothetical protein
MQVSKCESHTLHMCKGETLLKISGGLVKMVEAYLSTRHLLGLDRSLTSLKQLANIYILVCQIGYTST